MLFDFFTSEVTDDMMRLLLIVDPNRDKILLYVPDEKIIVAHDKTVLAGIGMITVEGINAELVSLAILENYRSLRFDENYGRGIGAVGEKHKYPGYILSM